MCMPGIYRIAEEDPVANFRPRAARGLDNYLEVPEGVSRETGRQVGVI